MGLIVYKRPSCFLFTVSLDRVSNIHQTNRGLLGRYRGDIEISARHVKLVYLRVYLNIT